MPIDDDYEFDDDPNLMDQFPTPPHGVRFGKGQPINFRGRPKGSQNFSTMANRVSNSRQKVLIDGKTRRKSTIELIILAIRLKASQGDIRAFDLMGEIVQTFDVVAVGNRGVLICQEKLTAEEWEMVYNPQIYDDELIEKFPYLLRAKRDHRAAIEVAEKRAEDIEAAYKVRRAAAQSDGSG